MKIITQKRARSLSGVMFFLLFSFSALAQTNEEIETIQQKINMSEIEQLASSILQAQTENKQLALQYAQIYGWDIIIITDDGVFMELQGITDELEPMYYQTTNREAGITARADHLYNGGSLGLNIEGQGMTAGVWDNGAMRLTHESFTGRATQMDGATTTQSHANHVGGTIIASNEFQSGSVTGMAFQANLDGYDWANDRAEATSAAAAGLLVSNHSYGYLGDNSGSYSSYTREWDLIMQYIPTYLAVFAAGNEGNTQNVISNLASGKNSLSVASVQELLNYTGPASVIPASNSSSGPTDDRRIKPDISAKGVNTYSINHTGDNSYITMSGTSMAAPSVTGTLLLLQQYYNQLNSNFMLAATLKALTIHSADEAGANPGPDIRMGWGLINAEAAANIITANGTSTFIEENTLNNSSTYTKTVIANGYQPLVVTIAWTDPFAAVAVDNNTTPRLIHDLDLRVHSQSTTSTPWLLDPSNPANAAIIGDNIVDNIEKIEIMNPIPGESYTITINHKGTLTAPSQNYGLIISGVSYCPTSLTINTNVNSGNLAYHQASSNIIANNSIFSGAEAIYHADNYVILQNGFTAESGSDFRAYIQGCTNIFDKSMRQNGLTNSIESNIEKIDIENGFEIYPNPTNSIFNIKLNGDQTKTNLIVKIYNINGSVMYDKQFNDGELNWLKINATFLPKGVYIVELLDLENQTIFTRRVVKI